jgi:hypothetical protein
VKAIADYSCDSLLQKLIVNAMPPGKSVQKKQAIPNCTREFDITIVSRSIHGRSASAPLIGRTFIQSRWRWNWQRPG